LAANPSTGEAAGSADRVDGFFRRGGRDSNANEEDAATREKTAGSSSRVGGVSSEAVSVETPTSEPEELEPPEQPKDRTGDAVEAALAKALQEALAAGRFDVVALLAGELRARRLAREGVTTLDARRPFRTRSRSATWKQRLQPSPGRLLRPPAKQ
jgi:hypothetical protein